MKRLYTIGRHALVGLRILFKFSLLLPILFGMVWFNFTVDRSGIFQGKLFEREVALSLLNGHDVSGNEQMDEREINALVVQNMKEAPNTIAMGSSRILQMSSDIAGTESFYNFGMIGADFKDLLGTFYLLDRADKLPQNIIIGLDPWLLNPSPEATDNRSDKILYEEFLALRLGRDSNYQPINTLEKYSLLFSPSYFQGNLEYYFRDANLEKRPSIVTGDPQNQLTDVKRHDGSVQYNKAFRCRSQEEIDHAALTEAVHSLRIQDFAEPDPALCALLDEFIRYAQQRGVNIIFMLVPYHPVLYSYITENAENYTGFFQTAEWYENYAIANNIPLYGGYNPYIAGCWYNDYYDGNHIKGEALERLFPGIPAAQSLQKLGRSGSPWLFEGKGVSYEMAEKIVAHLNQIEVPEVLKNSGNILIDGVPCYEILRFDSSGEDGILLARYAISRQNGVFYRYDSNLNGWTVDLHF